MKHFCPTCHKTIKVGHCEPSEKIEFSPFCSQRCKLIDLGEWLDAGYKISTPLQSQEGTEPTETANNSS
ncbi:MAG: DNA gyrase inhibitor YacG [Planctomycetes bacterium]|nr:DNA gyrase inhibitor YacG [Planctomycetota bacterium]